MRLVRRAFRSARLEPSVILSLLVLSLSACSPAVKGTQERGGTMTPSIIDPYLHIQHALADDSVDEVKANAGMLATAAAALGAPAAKIDAAALQLAEAGDLTATRDRFGTLSEAIVTYMDGFHLSPPEGVRIATCPMVNKPWLQQEATLANPYYGKSMLTCGSFR